jgi:hypothetical protein
VALLDVSGPQEALSLVCYGNSLFAGVLKIESRPKNIIINTVVQRERDVQGVPVDVGARLRYTK